MSLPTIKVWPWHYLFIIKHLKEIFKISSSIYRIKLCIFYIHEYKIIYTYNNVQQKRVKYYSNLQLF